VLAMISSLRAVGIILALGTLIGPAATVYLFVDSFTVMFWVSGLLGAFASLLGLLVSDWTDLPAGACIVLVLGLLFLVSFLLSPRYGLLRRLRKGHLHAQSLARWGGEGESVKGDR
jgi:ABC-type Mn2+/Zn2+ transport system permease subunit